MTFRKATVVSAPKSAETRPRIAYFVPPSPTLAGMERVVHELATGLADAHGDRLDVHVIFASRYDDPLLADTAYRLHVLDVDRLRALGAVLRRDVAQHRYDVLVVPQIEASVTAWVATVGLRVPAFVTHLHGNPRVEERDGTRRTRAAFQLFRRVVSPRLAAVLAVSPSLAAYARCELTPGVPVHFVPNPVRDFGAPGPRQAAGEEFRFVTVARLSHQKGQDLLLRALAQARPALPPCRLILVGSGPEEAALRRLCTELDLDDVVEFTGYRSDPVPHLRAADCFVLPSRWEGFGMVLLEALHVGLPLLAADCDFGPADLVTDPRIGDLVAPEDVDALADGLLRATTRPRDTDDEAFRCSVAAGYAPERTIGAHVAVLEQVLARSTVPGGRAAR